MTRSAIMVAVVSRVGLGLIVKRERPRLVGGRIAIKSGVGHGTHIDVPVPPVAAYAV